LKKHSSKSIHQLQRELLGLIKNDESIFSLVEQSALDGLWFWDLTRPEHEWMSEKFWRTLGYDPTEKQHEASEWQNIVHPDDLILVKKNIQKHCDDPSHPYDQIVRYTHKSGHVVWIRSRGVALRNKDGKAIRIVGSHVDVSELKKQTIALQKRSQTFEELENTANIGTWDVDFEKNTLWWSRQTKRIHEVPDDYEPNIATGINFYKEGESRRIISEVFERSVQQGIPYDEELELVTAKGHTIWVRAIGRPELIKSKCIRIFGVFQDITSSKRLKMELAKQHELLRVTLQSIGDALITSDTNGLVTWLNPIAEQLTGWTFEEAESMAVSDIIKVINEQTETELPNPISLCLQKKHTIELENSTALLSRDGTQYGITCSVSPICSEEGELLGSVMVFHYVTEERQEGMKMKHRATHDPLTGFYNRSEFVSRLNPCVNTNQDEQTNYAIAYIDLDKFKAVNDTCGHNAGDELLKQVSKLLKENITKNDIIARLGGDEFGLLLAGHTAEQALKIAQNLCQVVDSFRFVHDNRIFRIGASIGFVPITRRWPNVAELINAADNACYSAKKAGRNCVFVWKEEEKRNHQRTLERNWTTRIKQAIDKNTFELFAQRVLPLQAQSKDVFLEVLLRMPDGESNWILPNSFLPIAERYSLSPHVDYYVISNVISQLQRCQHLHRIGQININISGQTIANQPFIKKLFTLLNSTHRSIKEKLFFEMTEATLTRSMLDSVTFVTLLRNAGIKTALDDFGTGASSFAYLKKFEIEQMKIDGNFVSNILNDPVDEIAVKAFVDIAKLRNIEVVAKSVNSAKMLQKLKDMGVDYAQGYYLHEPQALSIVLDSAEEEATSKA
jgi:diguanylate cyclase (GGDEF)-like protein/PAS domain S-box-containing protein